MALTFEDFWLVQNFRFHSCERKVKYYDLGSAACFCSNMREFSTFIKDENLHPYQCVFDSPHWHIGNGGGAAKRHVLEMELLYQKFIDAGVMKRELA